MEHLNELSAPCATITGHRPSRLDDEAPAAAPRPRTGSLPIIPAQFFNREPHRFLPVAFLAISPPFDQSLLPFLGSCHEDLVELMLDPRINPEAADQLFGPSDAGPSDAEAADRPFGPSKADKTRPAQPLRGVPLPSIILPSIRIPAALPCLVFIVGVQSTKPFPASDCFKKGVLLLGDGHQTDRPRPAAAVTRRQGFNLKRGDGHQAARAASGGPADRGAWPPVRWPGMVETGDGLKPLYGRLMALAMWPG